MAIIPTNKHTTEYVIEHSKKIRERPRAYLGMSSIGHDCLRAQWYGWRWAKWNHNEKRKGISVRMRRLFDRGHLEEASIIPDLKKAGIEVFRRLGEQKIEMFGDINEEQEEIIGFHKHSKGHPDGRCLGVIEAPKTEHLLEMKTMNSKYYLQLLKDGLHQAFPEYVRQMTKYMGEMKLTRGLLVATNKNDSARKYIRVKFEKKLFEMLKEREENIILAEKPPVRRYHQAHYICNWCNFYQICYLNVQPAMNCRTCICADIEAKGKWSCSIHKKTISYSRQLRGCEKYKRLF